MESNNNINSRDEQQHQSPSPFRCWWDSHNRPPQSQWLHYISPDLDEKIKTILELIEDNGDTFARRAEMYYQKRPQLIKMVQDLHRSYRALADKYDQLQLKSEPSIKASHGGSSPSNSMRKSRPSLHDEYRLKGSKPHRNHEEYIEEFSAADSCESESATSSFEFQSPNSSNRLTNKTLADLHRNNNNEDLMMGERVWNGEQLKFSKLLEENLCNQAELIRRNNEKRDVINELRNENKILSQWGTMKEKKSQKKKIKRLFCFSLKPSC